MGTVRPQVLAAKARDHERRTGMIANMQSMGWRVKRRSKIDGTPLEFVKGSFPSDYWSINKDRQGKWKATKFRIPPGGRYPSHWQADLPMFEGPVTLAVFLSVEISNESVRFNESKNAARSA
jgi:hypothetical protein